jgi:hypothetical protein
MTGLPVDFKTQIKYSTNNDFGAVLVTAPPIHFDRFYNESPFKTWFNENVKALLSGFYAAELKKYGLFVITQTYSTEQCCLISWSSSSQEVSLGFDVEAPGILTLGPHTSWSSGSNANGWNHYKAKVCPKIRSKILLALSLQI